jgi:hypothetical protein
VLGVSAEDIRVKDRAEEARGGSDRVLDGGMQFDHLVGARGNQEGNPDAVRGAGKRVCDVIEQRAMTYARCS